ncbi:sialidase family protein [Paenibacillus thalictri]|uniref:Exo-alpha-sialidase n=1 Tax=Paenibacillus thalictri TaxID=2527873 RepID=A0A4Q9DNC0_9BACL|nr:sialidase family protein [Paenibacillus thalictri]TBL73943.1 exo-alpha-sialidase [Paenibacillus thalictri]
MSLDNPLTTEELAVKPLAPNFVKVYESPDPPNIWVYSPGIAVLPTGRLVATLDLSGPGMADFPGPKRVIEHGDLWFGKIFTSDDKGATWQYQGDFPFMHARPFVAGNSVYIIGHCNDLTIIRSDDWGETWSETSYMSEGQIWHQAPSNVYYTDTHVYLVMERMTFTGMKIWPCSILAPVLMRGKLGDDLLKRENWTFASELAYCDCIPVDELDYFGTPFFPTEPITGKFISPGRNNAPAGWLETNVVRFTDPDHYFYDPSGRTFHLWMRAHTGGTGLGAIAKVVENDDGTMTTMLEKAPSGRTMVFVPIPGGQMKFHIVYDEVDKLYWLLSSQATDSMTRAEKLPAERFWLPNNERHRLQLHFSRNCIDWCFAGLVDMGNSPKESRHYASLAIDGDDLYVLSRSGDSQAYNAHNGNFISFHTIKQFRSLVY